MESSFHQPNRRSIRWAGYDYAQCGAYFITICTHERKCVFGRVLDGEMHLNVYGQMVDECWNAIPQHFSHVVLDAWQIMPNHVHGIIVITPVGAGSPRPPNESQNGLPTNASPIALPNSGEMSGNSLGDTSGGETPPLRTLGQIVGYFKFQSTKRINGYRLENNLPSVKLWQRNYFERVIRDEKELDETRRYIGENPLHWATDENNVG